MMIAKARNRTHYPPLVLPATDHARLTLLIDSAFASVALTSDQRKQWRDRLQAATVISSDPSDSAVGMNSTVHLFDVDTGQREDFTLVYPEQACIERGRLSVLTPIGMSLLGSRVGDSIVWELPSGVRRLCVEQIGG